MFFSLNSTPQPRYSRPTGENKKRRRPPGAAPAPKKRRFLPKTQQEQGGHRLGGHRSSAKPQNFGASPPPWGERYHRVWALLVAAQKVWAAEEGGEEGKKPSSERPPRVEREKPRRTKPGRGWNNKNKNKKQRSVNENQEEGQGAPPPKKGAELPAPPLLPAGPVRGLLLLHLQPAAAALVQPGQLEIPAGRGGPEHPEVAPST